MSHILYDRASKLFMDKISQGWDEIGAHAAVEKKYGVRLADTILGDARAEMKAMRQNPRKEYYTADTELGQTIVAAMDRESAREQVLKMLSSYKKELGYMPEIKSLKVATEEDLSWVKAMSGYIPKIENPRGRHRYIDWKKQTEEAAEEFERMKERRKLGASMEDEAQEAFDRKRALNEPLYTARYRAKHNPRNPNKEEFGKIVDDENGIEKMVVVEKGHPGKWNYRVYAEPTKKGKEYRAYREIRHQLGDDWFSDITDFWWKKGVLPAKMQIKISNHIEGLRAQGYMRY